MDNYNFARVQLMRNALSLYSQLEVHESKKIFRENYSQFPTSGYYDKKMSA